MSLQKVYQRRQKIDKSSNIMGSEVQKLDSWLPETPAKPTVTRPLMGCLVNSCHISDKASNNEIGTQGASLMGFSFTALLLQQEIQKPNGELYCFELDSIKNSGEDIMKDGMSSSLELNKKGWDELLNPGSKNLPNAAAISFTLADPIQGSQCATEESATISNSPSPLPQCDNLAKPSEPNPSFDIPTPAKPQLNGKRKKSNDQDYNERSQKRPKKKVYWPKVIGQSKRRKAVKVFDKSKIKRRLAGEGKPKRTPKPKTKPSGVVGDDDEERAADEGKFETVGEDKAGMAGSEEKPPKPSTPEQITRTPLLSTTKSCRRSLKFNIEDESPHMVENATCQSISLAGSQKRILRRCPCLTKSKKIGPNFPKKCKRKRIPRIISFLQSIPKGKRSNGRIRRTNLLPFIVFPNSNQICRNQVPFVKHEVEEKQKGSEHPTRVFFEKLKMISSRTLDSLVKKFQSLHINDSNTRDLVIYKTPDGTLVPYKEMKKRQLLKVNLDEETLRVWNLLMDGKAHKERDEEKRKYWEQERNVYLGRVNSFISRMHLILGNRSFSPWKGSVLDSVVGVFLTQNVSDHLSSSAYMSLAAKFPIQTSPFNLCALDNKVDDEIETESFKDFPKVGNKGVESIVNLKKKKPDSPGMIFGKKKSAIPKKKIDEEEKEKEEQEEKEEKQYWETLRKTYTPCCTGHSDHMDSVDWEAVRCAHISKIAKAIEGRGQHNIIAQRIQAFLNKLMEMHGSINLEWLRYAPPNQVKDYLLKVYGLGLKSVECIRLLALQHNAFPVDVNVGRIAVRLGWVPLEPLPESIQIHLLEQFPLMDVIQKYLWPRLCTLDQPTLYELHYQLITFGKVFCTKKQPNCNACPMRGECRHFASAFASAKLALTAPVVDERPTDKSIVRSSEVAVKSLQDFTLPNNSESLSISQVNNISTSEPQVEECEPIIEMPASPEPENTKIVEEKDIEDFFLDDDDDSEEIITIKLNYEECIPTTHNYSDEDDINMSRALVALTADAKSIPVKKLKNVGRLRTERLVYVLPDTHPLLEGFKKREPDDPCLYLLVMWTPGELRSWSELTKNSCNDLDSTKHCFSCNSAEEENKETVPGTILIPCRTAMEGRFPLNGTYFQVNEVFADAESSKNPINVPRKWIWNLPTSVTYFGTSTSTILRRLSVQEIQYCFWRGFVCVRGFERKTGAPRPLSYRFHLNTTSKQGKKNAQVNKQ